MTAREWALHPRTLQAVGLQDAGDYHRELWVKAVERCGEDASGAQLLEEAAKVRVVEQQES